MNNACETGQPVRTLGSEMKTLRQWFCSNKLHDIQEQAGLGDSKKETSSACGSMGILRPSLWVPQVLFSRGWAECHGAKKVFALRGLRPVHFWARASTLHCLLLRMFLSAWEAKYLANTSSLIVQAGCQPRNPSSWTSKWHTSPSVCKAFLRRWRAIVSARCCWGRSLSCACFQQSVSRPCGLALQPRSSSLFKWGEGTTSAKGIPQVRLCSLQFPSMARMSCLSPAACIWAKRLEDMSRCGKSGKNELGNLENCYRIKWTLLSVAQSYAFWGKFLSGRQQQEIQIDQAWQTWGVHTKSNWLQWASRPCRSRTCSCSVLDTSTPASAARRQRISRSQPSRSWWRMWYRTAAFSSRSKMPSPWKLALWRYILYRQRRSQDLAKPVLELRKK